MWKKYFGTKANIYGVDINAACRTYETDRIKVFIGDQKDRPFWRDVKQKIPALDIVIDDGGHGFDQQVVSLEELLPFLRPGGVYLCELGTNNIFKHGEVAKRVFGLFNLNPHATQGGINSLESLRSRGWYHEGHSSHSPLLTAGKDLFDEQEMWDRISKCEINHYWSASIVQNKGKLRAYFCEVAAAFDLARGTDHGIEPVPGWWRRNVSEFEDQVALFCPGCGVPAKLRGHLDYEETDTYTTTNEDLAFKSLKNNRKIIKFTGDPKSNIINHKFTEYSQRLQVQAKQKFKYRVRSLLYREIPTYLRQMHYEVRRSLKRARLSLERPGLRD